MKVRRHSPRVLASGWLRGVAALAWLVAQALAPASAWGQGAAPVSERGVKAAFIYKFLGYAEWPASAFAQPDAPIVVGVIGADDIASELSDAVRGRLVGARPVEVRKLRTTDALDGLHVLFIGRSERARIGAIARVAQPRGILVITESDEALDLGSMINLVLIEGRVRFEVALEPADRAGIRLSSRLLAVAHQVRMGNN